MGGAPQTERFSFLTRERLPLFVPFSFPLIFECARRQRARDIYNLEGVLWFPYFLRTNFIKIRPKTRLNPDQGQSEAGDSRRAIKRFRKLSDLQNITALTEALLRRPCTSPKSRFESPPTRFDIANPPRGQTQQLHTKKTGKLSDGELEPTSSVRPRWENLTDMGPGPQGRPGNFGASTKVWRAGPAAYFRARPVRLSEPA